MSKKPPAIPTILFLRPAAELAAGKPHGTRIKYTGGCRCIHCRKANREYERIRSRERASGNHNGIIDAAPARTYLRKQSRMGVGYRQAASAAGVSRTIVAAILNGSRKRIRAQSLKRILGVNKSCRADKALVTAGPTWQRINALIEEGYTKKAIAEMIGQKRTVQIRKGYCLVKTEALVKRAYDKVMT